MDPKDMKSLLNVKLENKICLTRVDFNCPLDDQRKILDTTRIKAHAETIKHISDHLGKPVVIAHQGRPGSPDFSSLEEHAEKLQEILGPKYRVEFITQTHGSGVEIHIKAMNIGEILVLENVRQLKTEMAHKTAEEHATDSYISSLASIGDIFVNDAFSAAHRSHMSLVGFPQLLPSYPGLIMEREIINLQRVVDSPEKPCVFVMGGIKPEDSFKVAEHVLSQNIADYILTGGGVSLILLKAQEYSLGDKNEEFLRHTGLLKFVDIAQRLTNLFPERIKAQSDFACLDGGRRTYEFEDLSVIKPLKNIVF
jgi:phosphoglycerate kinase